MDPGWDHTENEDKLLLAHTSRMGTFRNRYMGTNVDSLVYRSDTVTNVSGIGCSNDNTSSNDEIISLSDEYINFLSNVIINMVNSYHNLLSSLLISYILYFYHLFPLHFMNFNPLFSEVINLKLSKLTYNVSEFSSLTSDIISFISSSIGFSTYLYKYNPVRSLFELIKSLNVKSDLEAVKLHIEELINDMNDHINFKINYHEVVSHIHSIHSTNISDFNINLKWLYHNLQNNMDKHKKSLEENIKEYIKKINTSLKDHSSSVQELIKLICKDINNLNANNSKVGEFNYDNKLKLMKKSTNGSSILDRNDMDKLEKIFETHEKYKECLASCLKIKSKLSPTVEKLKFYSKEFANKTINYEQNKSGSNIVDPVLNPLRNFKAHVDEFGKHMDCVKKLEEIGGHIRTMKNTLNQVESQVEDGAKNYIQGLSDITINHSDVQESINKIKNLNNLLIVKLKIAKYRIDFYPSLHYEISKLIIDFHDYDITKYPVDQYKLKCFETQIQSKIVIKKLLNSLEIYNKILLVIDEADRCVCVRNVSNKDENYKFYITGFYSNIHGDKISFDGISKVVTVGNNYCLCMVIKFILYPMIYKIINCIINNSIDLIKTIDRNFNKIKYFNNHNISTSNILQLVLILIYKISVEMQNRYLSAFSNIQPIADLYCFCRAPKDKYYLYYINIILVLSSLMENIWSMDRESVMMAIEIISIVLSEYQSITEIEHVLFQINCFKLVKGEKKEIVSLYDINIHVIQMVLRILNIQKNGQQITNNCSCAICTNMKLIKNIETYSNKVQIFKPILSLIEYIQELVTRCQMIKVYQYFANSIYQLLQNTKNLDIIGIINSINEISNIYSSFKDSPKSVELGIINNCKCDTCTNGKITCLCINLIHGLIVTLSLGKCANGFKCQCKAINVKCNPLRIECECTKCCIICLDYNEIMNCLCCINKCCDKSNECCLTMNNNCCENVIRNVQNVQEFSIFECQCKNIFEMIKKCSPNKELLSLCNLKKEWCFQCLNLMSKGVMITVRISEVVSDYINKFNIINKLNLLNDEQEKMEYVKCILIVININILRMTKNNLLNFNSHVSTKIIGLTNVETRNWGYDTKYEHDVTTDKGFSNQYPYVSDNYRTFIHNMSSFNRLKTYFIYYKSLNNQVCVTQSYISYLTVIIQMLKISIYSITITLFSKLNRKVYKIIDY